MGLNQKRSFSLISRLKNASINRRTCSEIWPSLWSISRKTHWINQQHLKCPQHSERLVWYLLLHKLYMHKKRLGRQGFTFYHSRTKKRLKNHFFNIFKINHIIFYISPVICTHQIFTVYRVLLLIFLPFCKRLRHRHLPRIVTSNRVCHSPSDNLKEG